MRSAVPSPTVQYSFAGRAVLVTGATGGMGLAVSSRFVAAGASVLMCDIAPVETGAAAAAACTATGPGTAQYDVVDVADEDAVRAVVSRCVDVFGGLHHAVNAAAIENETVPLHECSSDSFRRMMSVNVDGIFLSMKYEIAAMLADQGHHADERTVVNIASTNSVRPQPNQPAYTAAKHAVLGLTRSAAIDYASHGLRINAICPGSIDTPMLRGAMQRRGRDPEDVVARLSLLGRFGTPNEIAEATLWLSSPGSSFTLGHALAVDAGYLTR